MAIKLGAEFQVFWRDILEQEIFMSEVSLVVDGRKMGAAAEDRTLQFHQTPQLGIHENITERRP